MKTQMKVFDPNRPKSPFTRMLYRRMSGEKENSIMERVFGIDDSRNFHYYLEPYFWHETYERQYPFLGEKNYAPSDKTFDQLRTQFEGLIAFDASMFSAKSQQILIKDKRNKEKPEFLALLRTNNGKLSIVIAAVSQEVATKVITMVDEDWPPSVIVREDVVPFWFWTLTGSGPTTYKRKLEVCSWPEITENYYGATRDHMSALVGRKPPFIGGRLILWHGEPGTGKTHGIRALSHHWKHWCKAQYIMDPDRFFQNADYMMQVMMGKNNEAYDPDEDMDVADVTPGEDGKLPDKNKWNLIIVEDADEFMRADAKEREGQALSRLLNTSDGLVGQGLKVLILITTNMHIKELHPAVHRAGRCMSNIEFLPFDIATAREWLTKRGINDQHANLKQKPLLADMYELTQKEEERQIQTPKKTSSSTGQYL